MDLDNIVPTDKQVRRQEGAALIRPLRIFAKAMVQTIVQEGQLDYDAIDDVDSDSDDLDHEDDDDEMDYVSTIQGFANRNTQIWSPGKISDEDLKKQAYIAHDAKDDEVDFPGAIVQTGYDEDGVLRCGVCGQRMKLTKKDRAKGLTERKKLSKHMKSLHDREQQKRQTRLKQMKSPKKKKKVIEGKIGDQMKKYKAAQVGISRKGGGEQKSNFLFQVLKEEGVKVRSSDDVDEQLIRTATTWIKQEMKKYDSGTNKHGSVQDIVRGILVVASEDSDFCDLLKHAREKGFCAVTATPRSEKQTRALTLASDVVIEANDETDDMAGLRAEANTIFGRDLMHELPSPLILKSNGKSGLPKPYRKKKDRA